MATPIIKARPRLGEVLKELKMTQMELSTISGVTQGSISRFDKQSSHDDSHLVSILKALDISIDELFRIETQKGPD